MKKWNQEKKYINKEKNKKQIIKALQNLKNLDSFFQKELNQSQNKEKTKIYKKVNPKLITNYKKQEKEKDNKEKKNNNILYRKKIIYNLRINPKQKMNSEIYNDENNIKLFEHKNIYSENSQIINSDKPLLLKNIDIKNSPEKTTLIKSESSKENILINEMKIKLDLDKRKSNNIIIEQNDNKIKNARKKRMSLEDKNYGNNSIIIKSDNFIKLKQNKSCENIIYTNNSKEEKLSLKNKISNYPINKIKIRVKKNQNNINQIFSLTKKYNSNLNIINNKYEPFICKYLDNKSLLFLSSTNKILFKNIRIIIYRIIYEKLLMIKNNNKEDYIKKIIYNLFNHSSNKLRFRNKIQLKTKYNFYLYKSIFNDKIKQDLFRTFPQDKLFNTNSNYNKLYNILTSYSNYNKLIGYTQGLNFIAATGLYLFDTEEEVFLFLDCLINRFNLEKYLSIENINLADNYNYFCHILNEYVPDIVLFFEEKGINHCFFSISWMLTLFSNSMKRKYLIKTWCFMILLGWKFFYSFVIQILIYYKSVIISKEGNKLSDYMKTILNNDNFCKNYNSIIKNTFNFMNNNIIL